MEKGLERVQKELEKDRMDVKKELENLTIMTNSKPDWKQELREVVKNARFLQECSGASWDITISDERMQKLEAMGLWDMNAAGWND